MAFVKRPFPKVDDWGYTTGKIESCDGYFEPNTKVCIVDISEFGYTLEDEFGNYICDTGFGSFSLTPVGK